MQPYLGQISTFAFGLIPKGWLPCNGQLLAVNSNQALYSLLGTTYGGDGRTTFALPNLQGSFPVGSGVGYTLGTLAGETNHTLLQSEMPAHTHPAVASSAAATQNSPSNNFPCEGSANSYATAANTMLGNGSSSAGGSQPHTNMPPYLALAYCIAISGLFPPRN